MVWTLRTRKLPGVLKPLCITCLAAQVQDAITQRTAVRSHRKRNALAWTVVTVAVRVAVEVCESDTVAVMVCRAVPVAVAVGVSVEVREAVAVALFPRQPFSQALTSHDVSCFPRFHNAI